MRRAALLLLASLAACATRAGAPPPSIAGPTGALVPEGGAERPPTWELPERWAELEPFAFERLVEAELPADGKTRLSDGSLEKLSRALDGLGERAVRAAVILARSRTERATEIMLARLERRVLRPEVHGDAGDVVLAAALADHPDLAGARKRCLALAVGDEPHPDLEVRVECARSALLNGSEKPVDFLLAVLRIDTSAGRADRRDFEVHEQSAWARSRAAEALAARAGVPCTYLADAPMADREREARRLAELLGR